MVNEIIYKMNKSTIFYGSRTIRPQLRITIFGKNFVFAVWKLEHLTGCRIVRINQTIYLNCLKKKQETKKVEFLTSKH